MCTICVFMRKLCERGIAGVCIEDKLFPKTNSFIGEAQPLAERPPRGPVGDRLPGLGAGAAGRAG